MDIRQENLRKYFIIIACITLLCLPGHIVVSKTSDMMPGAGLDDTKVPVPSIKIEPIDGLITNEYIPRAGLLYDVTRKQIVWHKNLNGAFPIASLTKMMTALIAVEDIKAGKHTWATEVKVTREAAAMGGSKVYIKAGDTFTLEELIKSTMISSGNDAAYLVAQFIGGGDVNVFVQRMNQRAQELGMVESFFGNPTGLPAANPINDNRSTPMELLKLAIEILNHDDLVAISGMSDAVIQQGSRTQPLRNHNRLAVDYSEIDGLKTGYTRNAKFCLVATSNRCSNRLIAVALGCESSYVRNDFVAGLLSSYYTNRDLGRIGEAEDAQPIYAANKPLKLNVEKTVPAVFVSTQPTAPSKYTTTTVNKVYTVRSGDNLTLIANKYNCSVSDIRKWNKLSSTKVMKGQKLKIVTTEKRPVIYASTPAPTQSEHTPTTVKTVNTANIPDPQRYTYYVVQSGDTLWNIAQRYNGMTVKELMELNKIGDTRSLKPGTKIKVLAAS